MFDWSAGRYETTAEMLGPASERIVELSGAGEGDRFLDIACGTGNAALIAARRGAKVTGIDLAERLVQVAQDRAGDGGLEAKFVSGDAQDLPFADGSFDVAVSVFGVIFAADAEKALSEAIRVVRPGGRVLISAWVQEGTINRVVTNTMQAVMEATGTRPSKRFAWSDPDVVGEAAARHGADLEVVDDTVAFTADSLQAYNEDMNANHPMQIAAAAVLKRAGTFDEVEERAMSILEEGNEATDGSFRTTSHYRVMIFTKRNS